MEERLLRIDEVAHRLGLQPSTIRKLIYLRQIPVVHPTRRAVRVRENDVEALIRLGYKSLVGGQGHPQPGR